MAWMTIPHTLQQTTMASEDGPFMVALPTKSSDFAIVMLVSRRSIKFCPSYICHCPSIYLTNYQRDFTDFMPIVAGYITIKSH